MYCLYFPCASPKSARAEKQGFPDSKVHGANMGPIWGRQGPGGPHVGPMNFAIWVLTLDLTPLSTGISETINDQHGV